MIDLARLEAQLVLHEDRKLHMYPDTAVPPRITIGVGHNLTDKGITRRVSDVMLEDDIEEALGECERTSWFQGLDPVRQNALTEIMFALGPVKLAKFVNMLAAIQAHNWPRAAAELTNSHLPDHGQWGPVRVKTLSDMLLFGTWP